MSIPLSSAPVVYTDKDTGVRYFLRPSCGETETLMFDLLDSLPQGKKEREQHFTKNRKEVMRFDDASIDIILSGWESDKVKLPPFPKDGRPSQMMKWDLKVAILSFYNSQKTFSGEEIKK
jgi:hypothetical protein